MFAIRHAVVTALLLLPGLSVASPQTFPQAVVAADHPAASAAGIEMLQQGGNVVDAAVATSFALSVVRPASCGIGGGGFMLIWDAEKHQAVALDYRERAPASATPEMFAQNGAASQPEDASVRGGRAVAVPGTVAGLCYAAEHYGTLPLATLLAPAIRLAHEGVAVDEFDVEAQHDTLGKLNRFAGYDSRFASLRRLYLNRGQLWSAGDRFHSPQHRLLQIIAAEGRAGFYEGRVAEAIAGTVRNHGGAMTMDDLRTMQPVVRAALVRRFGGADIVTMPPPSSGGVALLQMLQTLERWETESGRSLNSLHQNSADYIHVVTEAMKHAFADRAEFLGDSDFVDVPVRRLLDADYAGGMAGKITLNRTLSQEAYGRFFNRPDAGTSHFSVIDAAGNAVACTETINLTYGSFVVVPEFGVVLNNEMDDFAARPGEPNAFGLIQSNANAVAAGKKPLSSMTPTILVVDNQAVFASGASGGPRIISATLQSILNHVVFGMPPDQAVATPRFHHQWSPNELLLEEAIPDAVARDLQSRGHAVKRSSGLAAAQAAARDASGLTGGSDPRKGGKPAGF
ncbi:MAG: gamma-glutamyltransferase [Planctomycetaceae bacterium]